MSDSPSPDRHNKSHEQSLPKGWSRSYSKSQKRHYYFHQETKHTQWHFPTASEVADPLKAKRRAELNKDQDKKRGQTESGLGNIGSGLDMMESSSNKKAKRPRDHTSSSSAASSSRTSTKTKPTAATAASAAASLDDSLALADSTSVAIIVPYRDLHAAQQRAAHLKRFVPHMMQFLGRLQADGLVSEFHIYIIEQSNDERKFNRGKLLNIGFDMARKAVGRHHDVFIFHDVDLLPQPDLGELYAKFPKTPLHIARVWDRYSNNPKYFGGVVSFSSSDFKRINGYPNTFWGWGGEDDEMQKRLERLGIRFDKPDRGTLVDLEQMTLTEKLDFLRANKEWKCMVKWEALEEHEKTWKTNGLADLKYTVLESKPLDDKATKITVDVQLNGNHWANDKCGVHYMGG